MFGEQATGRRYGNRTLFQKIRHSIAGRAAAFLIVVSLVGTLGYASSNLVNSERAQAAGTGYTVANSFEYLNYIQGTLDGAAWSGPTAVRNMFDSSLRVANTYCLDVTKWGIGPQNPPVFHEDQTTTLIPNLDKIRWLVNNSFPYFDLTKLAQNSGGTYSSGLSAQEAVSATQAAIWTLSNSNWSFNTADPVQYLSIDQTGVNGQDIVTLYNYLMGKINSGSTSPVPTNAPLSIDTSKAAVGAGDMYGPITVTTRDGAVATVTTNNTAEIYVNNTMVGTSADIPSGQAFYIKRLSTSTTSVTLNAVALATIPIGTPMIPAESQDQPMIVSNSYVFQDKTTSTVNVSGTASNPSIQLVKTVADASGNKIAELNEKLTYTFTVTNNGNVTLAPVTITDPKLNIKDAPCTASLAPGQSAQCSTTGSYTVTQADITATKIDNTATATGTYSGSNVSANASQSIPTAATEHPAITLVKGHQTPTIDANNNGIFDVGDQINYTFTVTNSGDVALANITLSDPMLTAAGITVSCVKTTLAPSESTQCSPTGAYTIKSSDVVDGKVTNTATVTGTSPANAQVNANSFDIVSPQTPQAKLTLTKKAVLTDSNNNGVADVGEMIKYSFDVKNDGNIAITAIKIDDAKLKLLGAACADQLAVGATATCSTTIDYVVTQADVDAGTVVNKATASGAGAGNTPVTSNESATTTPAATTSDLTLTKSITSGSLQDANNNGITDAGDSLSYTFLVTNTGAVSLNNVTIADAMLAKYSIAVSCQTTTLGAGATTTCTSGRYTINAADIVNAQVHNVATATGTTPSNTTVTSNQADAVLPVQTATPKLALEKTVADSSGNKIASVGETLTYSFKITNPGNVTVTNINIAETKFTGTGTLSAVSCPATELAPNASMTCTATYVTTQADADAGKIDNTAVATGSYNNAPVTSNEAPASIPTPVASPSLTLAKTAETPVDANHDGITDAGDTVVFNFQITNNGNVTATNVHVNDAMLTAAGVTVTCPKTVLAPNETMSCKSGIYTISSADQSAGWVKNVATATGTTPDNKELTTSESATQTPVSVPSPRLEIKKTAKLNDSNGNGTADVGETIDYTFTVANAGNTALVNVKINDAKVNFSYDVGALAIGQSVTIAAQPVRYTVVAADVANCQDVVNQAQVTGNLPATGSGAGSGTDPGTGSGSGSGSGTGIGAAVPPATGTAQIPVSCKPALELTKSVLPGSYVDVNHDGLVNAGDTQRYTFTVKNTCDVNLTDVAISDVKLGLTAGQAILVGTLAPGAPKSVEAPNPYTITDADVQAGLVHNIATAVGKSPKGEDVTSKEAVTDTPTSKANPAISLIKHAALADANSNKFADVNEKITYSFEVKNTGNIALSKVTIDDPKFNLAGAACVDNLAIGATATCSTTASYVVTQEDLFAGSITNTATAHGFTPSNQEVTSQSSVATAAAENPMLGLVKLAQLNDADSDGKADQGETIRYRFLLANLGTVELSKISISDQMLAAANVQITCPSSTLPVASVMTCLADPYSVTQADVEAGLISNVAIAHASTPLSTDVASNKSGVDISADQHPLLALLKTAQLDDANANKLADEGEKINYSFKLTNAGNVSITNLAVDDAMLAKAKVAITCPVTTLKPGESTTCTAAPYIVTAADVTANKIYNHAVARGSAPGGSLLSPPSETYTPAKPNIPVTDSSPMKLAKKGSLNDANGDGKAGVGETVVYTFELVNPGQSIITGIKINDPMLANAQVAINCPTTTLKPGEAMICQSAPYTVTKQDVAAGKIKNVANATYSKNGSESSSSNSAEFVIVTVTEEVVANQPVALARTGAEMIPFMSVLPVLFGGLLLLRRRRT